MRRTTGILLLVFILSLVFGCSQDKPKEKVEKKPVRVAELSMETRPIELDYIGTVKPRQQKKYSFEVGGKITGIYVQEGDYIKNGQRLASLDREKVNYQVQAAELDVEQAQKDFEDARDLYQKMKKLYKAGAVSREERDNARLQMEIKKDRYEQAKVNYDSRKSVLEDTVLTAGGNGYVVDVLFEEGEMVKAGLPVVVARSPRLVVKVGLSQQDMQKVNAGAPAEIKVDNLNAKGRVESIARVPDSRSRTYEAEIELAENLPGDKFYVGSIANVSIRAGKEEGIWIPIKCILNDGMDYVYLVQEGRAVRKNISKGKVHGNKVMVTGLSPGERLVTEGMKDLRDGCRVSAKNDEQQ